MQKDTFCENQIYNTKKPEGIVRISLILRCQKTTEGIRIKLENHFFPNWKQQKTILLNRKPFEKLTFFSKNVSSRPQCAKNPKESFMLAKFMWFLVKIEGAFDKNKFKKVE